MSGPRSSTGRELQTDGPATEKARQPYVLSPCRWMTRWWRLKDHRHCRAGTSDTGMQQSATYCGAFPCWHPVSRQLTCRSQKYCRGSVQTAMPCVCSHSNSYNWRSRVRSSLKDALSSSIIICRLNAMYDSDVLTDTGRAFQACAAATGNARLPSVVCRVVGTSSVDIDPELSLFKIEQKSTV